MTTKKKDKKLSIKEVENIVAERLAEILVAQLDYTKMLKRDKKSLRLRFREVNRDIFESIWDGRKKIETRAATVRYQKAKKGDRVIFVCGDDIFEKRIADAHIFKSVDELLKKYKVKQINPNIETEEELRKMFYSFPGYREKIKKHGLLAIELENFRGESKL